MSFQLLYRKIFRINLFHGFYLGIDDDLISDNSAQKEKFKEEYKATDHFTVEPSPTCLRILQKYKFIFVRSAQGFDIAARVSRLENDTFTPFIEVNEPISLSFYLKVTEPEFSNYSNIPPNYDSSSVLYFSNTAANSRTEQVGTDTDIVNYLSLPIESFDLSRNYQIGDLVVDDTDNPSQLFELVTSPETGDGSPGQTGSDRIWKPLELRQYLSSRDVLPIINQMWRKDVEAFNASKLRIRINDITGKTWVDQTFKSEKEGEPIKTLKISFNGLPSGKYLIESIDSQGNTDGGIRDEICYNESSTVKNQLGLIEILINPDLDPSSYPIFSEDKSLLPETPSFTVWFKNRSTRWRYIFKTTQQNLPTDEDFFFEDANQNSNKVMTSKKHLTLSRLRRIINLNANTRTKNESQQDLKILLPNPGTRGISQDKIALDDQGQDIRNMIVSNVFMDF